MGDERKNDPLLPSGTDQSGPSGTAGTETVYCGGPNDQVWPGEPCSVLRPPNDRS